MSNIVDRVFNEVCLDERITDGVFQLENTDHMDALRDYFIKRGIAREAAVHVTNRMVEGKYPPRQAFNKDGILCTFPTPKHKAKAIARGTHFEKNPNPKASVSKEEPKTAPPGSKPEPGEKPAPEDSGEKSLPKSDNAPDDEGDEGEKKAPTIFQGDKELQVEPPRGKESPNLNPPSPTVPPAPRTPERIAAEKEVVRQIMNTDDTALSNVANPINVNESCRCQLNELYKKAYELGFKEAEKTHQKDICTLKSELNNEVK